MPPHQRPLKQGDHTPLGETAGKHQMQQVKSILLPPTRTPDWLCQTAHEIVIGERG